MKFRDIRRKLARLDELNSIAAVNDYYRWWGRSHRKLETLPRTIKWAGFRAADDIQILARHELNYLAGKAKMHFGFRLHGKELQGYARAIRAGVHNA